jgi:glycosyltransferase involved in cell wall biosynthesis
MKYRLGILSTHPIQYFSPWYRALAQHPDVDLTVYYAFRQTPEGQAAAGFRVPFEWDRPLLEGYRYQFLKNRSRRPGTDNFFGCDTPEIADLIARERFHAFLVGGWHSRCFWQAIHACRKTGTPVMVRGDSQLNTSRSWMRRLVKYPFYRWFIPRFDGYLVVGQRAREYLRHYGASEDKMFSAPHAVDNRYFSESADECRRDRKRWRQEWALPPESTIFLFVGKLVVRKRPMDFLRAIRQAASGCPGLFGLVAGDGPLRSELESYVKAYHLPVRFSGFLNQSQLPRAYAAADVLVLPSDGSETWGLVVNEAMASGLPVIVSDAVGCGPDLVLPERTGDVFPAGDVQALGAVMGQMASDSEKRDRLGAAARAHIAGYSLERAVEGVVDALRHLPARA